MSHHQPGPATPDGQQGPQQPQGNVQPGYGLPQQPPMPPQPAYGQQPMMPGQPAQPGPYGQQQAFGQASPPRPGGGGNKAALIVAASVATLALLGGGLYFFTAGGDAQGSHRSGGTSAGVGTGDGNGSDPTAFKLTKPDTLLSGEYTLSAGGQESDGRKANPDIAVDGMTVQGRYTSGQKQLALSGVHGTIKDPEKTVDALVTGMSQKLGGGPVSAQEPAGFDGDAMKCGSVADAGQAMVFCSWGDAGTVGTVMWTDGAGSSLPSLAEFAGTTLKVRNEVRVEK